VSLMVSTVLPGVKVAANPEPASAFPSADATCAAVLLAVLVPYEIVGLVKLPTEIVTVPESVTCVPA